MSNRWNTHTSPVGVTDAKYALFSLRLIWWGQTSWHCRCPENTMLRSNVGSMFGQRRRRWFNIEPTLGPCIVLPGLAQRWEWRSQNVNWGWSEFNVFFFSLRAWPTRNKLNRGGGGCAGLSQDCDPISGQLWVNFPGESSNICESWMLFMKPYGRGPWRSG